MTKKKTLKLRNKVKKFLFYILIVITLVGIVVIDTVYTNNAVETCINNGQEEKICEELKQDPKRSCFFLKKMI